MKVKKCLLVSLIIILGLSFTASKIMAAEKVLYTGTQYQKHSMWCWAATCRNALKHFMSNNPSQCAIANWSLGKSNCCGNTTFKWNHSCNVGRKIYKMLNIVRHWGRTSSTVVDTYLKYSTAKALINNNDLFTMRFKWKSGGAHHILGKGWGEYSGTKYIARFDPWPGEGSSWSTYSSTVSSSKHTWSHTLKIR